MTPIKVTAHLVGELTLPPLGIALDGLLVWAEADRRNLPPPGFGELEAVEIPIALSDCGRYYLASFSQHAGVDQTELRYVNKRPVIEAAQLLGDSSVKKLDITAGKDKGFRIPQQVEWVGGDRLWWFAIGEPDAVFDLLQRITHLGKRRVVGRGRVVRWEVSPVEPWGEGFPVYRDGQPLRSLPEDAPVSGGVQTFAVLKPPYWEHRREEPAVVPC